MLELTLNFTNITQLTVNFEGKSSKTIEFKSPLTPQNQKDLKWYVEEYPTQYAADVDDDKAERIANQLIQWGQNLFDAVFYPRDAERLFNAFQERKEPGRIITIKSEHPAILSLPWELLHEPNGVFLFNQKPRISIRRNLGVARVGQGSQEVITKEKLRLLFVISRPTDANFLNHRTESMAMMEALDNLAQKGIYPVELEFLRPATLDNLIDRLENEDSPPIDIVHFDGHGVFDTDGSFKDEANKTTLPEKYEGLKKDDSNNIDRKNIGYLLFENNQGKKAVIDAKLLGQMLYEQNISLVVLSACQSAMMAQKDEAQEETTLDAMGSVAARLTQTGIPSVIAMTYSVLIDTTRELFGSFYQNLVQGKGIGESLDNARRHLFRNTERGERQRGDKRITLTLQDWFLPALYQSGNDVPLLSRGNPPVVATSAVDKGDLMVNNLPKHPEAGFFGRSYELWQIERWFISNTRRITISGFGGQGKTALAIEVGNWLQRTGMFEKVGFVSYAAFQSVDAVGYALLCLGTVFNASFTDEKAIIPQLQQFPTLIILDNLEAIAPEPLRELLTVAQKWSEVGQTRLLLTTRAPDLNHPDYKTQGSLKHRSLNLDGLGSEDALDYVRRLMQFPPEPSFGIPERTVLLELLGLVRFHPLSIGILVPQIKKRRSAELGQALERAITETKDIDDKDRSLVASLRLSLERIDAKAQHLLPRLGVFQGGAFEDDLLVITGFNKSQDEQETENYRRLFLMLQRGDLEAINATFDLSPAQNEQLEQLRTEPEQIAALLENLPVSEFLAEMDEATWLELRQALENTGLIQLEYIENVRPPYLKFHPTLAPVLWLRLSATEQNQLTARHRQQYYQLSRYLYQEDQKNAYFARSMVKKELPNLLYAVHNALDAGEDWAVEFVDNVNKFLDYFGLNRDRAELTERVKQLVNQEGSDSWYLARSNIGEQLFSVGRYGEAAQVFAEILAVLGEKPSYERCFTLTILGRCFRFQGQAAQAASLYRQGLEVAAHLEPSDDVKGQIGVIQTDLGTVLTDMGDYEGAKTAYEQSLAIDQETGDSRGEAVTQGQLGTLALKQGNLSEAAQCYQEALTRFRQLNEPAQEAIAWHQLGMVYQEAKQWEAAEQAYREAARIKESLGDKAGAARTWNQIARVNEYAGKPELAEAWYRKAIKGGKEAGDILPASRSLTNLANLLQNDSHRLPEARQLAEEALTIMQTLDPNAAEIWKIYSILANISEKQGDSTQARAYRRLMRQSYAAFPGARYQLQPFADLIAFVVSAVEDEQVRQELEPVLEDIAQRGWGQLVAAIRRFLGGERDEDVLCEGLDYQDGMIMMTILSQCVIASEAKQSPNLSLGVDKY